MAPENVFSTRTEQNTSGIIVCLVHLEQYLVKKMVQNCRYEVFNND